MAAGLGGRCPSGTPDVRTGWPEHDDPWDEFYDLVPESERKDVERIKQEQSAQEAWFFQTYLRG